MERLARYHGTERGDACPEHRSLRVSEGESFESQLGEVDRSLVDSTAV